MEAHNALDIKTQSNPKFFPYLDLLNSIDKLSETDIETWTDILDEADRTWKLNYEWLLQLCETERFKKAMILSNLNIRGCVSEALSNFRVEDLELLWGAKIVIDTILFIHEMITKIKERICNYESEVIAQYTRAGVNFAREWGVLTIWVDGLKSCDFKTGNDEIDSIPFIDYIVKYFRSGNNIIYWSKQLDGPIKDALSLLNIDWSIGYPGPDSIKCDTAMKRFSVILLSMLSKGYLKIVEGNYKINFVLKDE